MPDAPLPGWPRALPARLAAAYVGLSETAIRTLAGFPRPVQLSPGRVAWLREDLDAWLDSRAGRPAASAAEPNPWDAPPDAGRRAPQARQ